MRNNIALLLSLCVLLVYTAAAASHDSTCDVKSISRHHTIKHTNHHTAHGSGKKAKKSSKKSAKKVTKKKHATKHASKHSVKHASKHSVKHSVKHASKHSVKHASKHSVKHASKHSVKHASKHTTKHASKHSKHSKHASKHSKHSKHASKHTSKHASKHATKKVSKHTTKTTKASNSNKSYPNHKIIAYVLDWAIPKNIKWSELDHIAYAFAEPNAKGALKNFDSANLKSVVTQAHKNNVGVSISVAGWSGSIHMSALLNSNSTRETLVKNIVGMVKKFSLDGVNIDWEFPNSADSISCASRNANDTANFLTLIQLLREKLDAEFPKVHKVITVAASNNPFADSNGYSSKKLDAGWASTVDYFYLMSYEYNGNWNDVAGPNAALQGSSHGWGVETSVNLWYNAGIPKSKMHVGVTFYGKALKTSQAITSTSGMYVKLDGHYQIQGDKYDELAADPCPKAVAGYTGEYQWRSIVANGILDNKNGWTTYWDEQSQTPYAYHSENSTFLSYDNPKSLEAKVDYVNKQGLAGFMVWSLEMDDSKHTLLKTIQGVRK